MLMFFGGQHCFRNHTHKYEQFLSNVESLLESTGWIRWLVSMSVLILYRRGKGGLSAQASINVLDRKVFERPTISGEWVEIPLL